MNIPQFREKHIEWVNKQPGEMVEQKLMIAKAPPRPCGISVMEKDRHYF